MIIDELFEAPELCPECGGISFSDLILAEKKDACYYKVKASAKVWPSAYASGRLVQCRKKGAANYGKSKTESVAEGSLNEFDTTNLVGGPEGNDPRNVQLKLEFKRRIEPWQHWAADQDDGDDAHREVGEIVYGYPALRAWITNGYNIPVGPNVPPDIYTKIKSSIAKCVNELIDIYGEIDDRYYNMNEQGVAEGDLEEASVYKKDQDLSSIPTQELEAFVKKHWGGGVPTYGQGKSVQRAMRELRRRQKQGVAEATGDEKFDTMMGRIQQEPKYPDPQMPPTDVKDLYQWAVKNNKPYHKIFAKWANREGFKSVAPALERAGNLDTDALDYWTPDVWKIYWGEVRGIDSEMPPEWAKQRIPDELRDYLETVFDAYDHIVFDWPTEYRQIGQQGMAEGYGNWYVRVNGKVLKDKKFDAIPFPSKETATQKAMEIHDKKRIPLDMIKLTQSWMDGPETQGMAEQQELDEKWSEKYKKSINCANPKGFSQRAHCAGRKKNEDMELDEADPRYDPTQRPGMLPLELGGGGAGGSTPKWTPTRIPGVDIHTGPPPKVTVQKRGADYEPLASEVPAYVRKGLPEPTTVSKTMTVKSTNNPDYKSPSQQQVDKPRITVKPGETAKDAIQRAKIEKEFGDFMKGQSGQTFGSAGAGRGDPAAWQKPSKIPTLQQTVPVTDTSKLRAITPSQATDPLRNVQPGVDEAKKSHPPEADYDQDYQDMVARVKKLAGLGPLKTVYDPKRRVYRNMPTAQQPKK